MRKIIALALILLLSVCLFACNDTEQTPGNTTATTAPAETIPSTTEPTPDQKTIYTGPYPDGELTVEVLEGVASVAYAEIWEHSPEDLQEWGITGTLTTKIVQRMELPIISNVDGLLRVEGAPSVCYISYVFEGTAAEAYIAMGKPLMDQYLASGEISQEEYDQQIKWINGEETEESFEDPDTITMEFQLKDDMSCWIQNAKTVSVSNPGDMSQSTYEYKDGYLYKFTNYLTDYINEGAAAWVTTYYPNGQEQYKDRYYLTVDAGQFVLGELSDRDEYHEDGRRKYSVQYWSGAIFRETLYDDIGEEIKSIEYMADGSGTVSSYTLYEETETHSITRIFNGKDQPTQEWYYKKGTHDVEKELFYNYNEDGTLDYYSVEEETDTTITESQFDSNDKPLRTYIYLKTEEGNQEQKTIYYDESGNVQEYYEYTYEGNIHTQTLYDANGDIQDITTREYDENGNVVKMTERHGNGEIYRISEYQYDPETGRQIQETEYDGNGNVIGIYTY